MKIQTTGGALHAAASWAAKIAPTKPVIPMLAAALLDASDPVTLAATDLDSFGRVTVAGTAMEDGRVAVSARLLASVTKMLARDAEITVVGPDARNRVEITSGKARWALPTIDTEDWPAWPTMGDEMGKVPAEILLRALARVLPAASNPVEPPMHGGITVDVTDRLTLAATDRYRLAIAEVDWQPVLVTDTPRRLIVPGELLRALAEAAKGAADEVVVSTDGNTVGLGIGGHQVIGRLLAGYPDWERVVATADQLTATTVVVEVALVAEAAERAAVVLSDKEPLQVAISADGVQVSPATGDSGDAEQFAAVREVTGEPITFWADPHYLRDALACLDAPLAVLSFSENPGRPILLRAADNNGEIEDGYRHILMPRFMPQALKAAA